MSYLHGFRPIVVHGDLKGVRILHIDNNMPIHLFSSAIYWSMTVAKLSSQILALLKLQKSSQIQCSWQHLSLQGQQGLFDCFETPGYHTDTINNSRWMAPELLLALVEDEQQPPPITTHSDVYSFGCVCLEVIHV